MDFWDVNRKKVMGSTSSHCAVAYGWSPDSRWFLTATCAPRMNVDNDVKVGWVLRLSKKCAVCNVRTASRGSAPLKLLNAMLQEIRDVSDSLRNFVLVRRKTLARPADSQHPASTYVSHFFPGAWTAFLAPRGLRRVYVLGTFDESFREAHPAPALLQPPRGTLSSERQLHSPKLDSGCFFFFFRVWLLFDR